MEETKNTPEPSAQQNPRKEAIGDLYKTEEFGERQSGSLSRIEELLKQQHAETNELLKQQLNQLVKAA